MSNKWSLQVRRNREGGDALWAFFDKIPDVANLEPHEEQSVGWECIRTDTDEVVGMVVVDTFSDPFINRIAVKQNYRRIGVATRLLRQLLNEYESLRCRIHVDNHASQKLFETVGFEKERMGRYEELIKYTYNN